MAPVHFLELLHRMLILPYGTPLLGLVIVTYLVLTIALAEAACAGVATSRPAITAGTARSRAVVRNFMKSPRASTEENRRQAIKLRCHHRYARRRRGAEEHPARRRDPSSATCPAARRPGTIHSGP